MRVALRPLIHITGMLVAFVLLLPQASLAQAEAVDAAHEADDHYPLDSLDRDISPQGRMHCPSLEMTRYKGKHVRYHKPVYIYAGFQDRLERFESIASEVATEIYGRKPRRIVHIGTYNCRRIRRIPDLLSEHALGNAIDIEGFDFGPAKGVGEREASPQRRLRRGFTVRVDQHWNRDQGVGALHSKFLRTLTERLIEDDVFRVLLGPAFPGHQDHFHFDQAPYRLVSL